MKNIHASCVAIAGKGVLLLGESGAGKSDLALRLVDDGAHLVADDRTELYVAKGRICARAPKSNAGLMEMRGLGIVALPFAKSTVLALAVEVGKSSRRLPEPAFFAPLKEAKPVPLIRLDGRLSSAPARIRLALKAFDKSLFRGTFNPT